MPHIIVKLWPGKTEQQKRKFADEITRSVTSVLKYGDESVSVGFEEIGPDAWMDQVYKPDIDSKWGSLYKQPGYGPRT